MNAIDRETARLFARSKGPVRQDRERLRIEDRDLTLVLDVRVDLAAIADCRLRRAAESYGTDDRAIRGVDRGRVGAAAVEREDALRSRIVENRIRISARNLNDPDRSEGFVVEDRHGGIAAVAGESSIELGRESDAVDSRCIRDVSDDGVTAEIDDHGVSSAREK